MRHKAFTFWEAIAIVAVVLIVGAVLFPYLTHTREMDLPNPLARCRSNLRQITLGLFQYSQDYDETFPPSKNSQAGLESPTNWVGLLQPYIKSVHVFHCPLDRSNNEFKRSSYGYNQRLSQLSSEKLHHFSFTLTYFEVDSSLTSSTQTGSNVKDVTASLCHDDGANYAFADGHVKWLRPDSITTSYKYSDGFTFAIE